MTMSPTWDSAHGVMRFSPRTTPTLARRRNSAVDVSEQGTRWTVTSCAAPAHAEAETHIRRAETGRPGSEQPRQMNEVDAAAGDARGRPFHAAPHRVGTYEWGARVRPRRSEASKQRRGP